MIRCSDCSCCTTDKVLGVCFECGDHRFPNCDWHMCPDLIAPTVPAATTNGAHVRVTVTWQPQR